MQNDLREDLSRRILDSINGVLGDRPALERLDLTLDEVHLDSLRLSEVILALERDLGLELADDVLVRFSETRTLEEILEILLECAAHA